jgi:hypothetical protein
VSSFSWPTVTATNPSVSGTGVAAPTSATLVGGSDGTNLVAVKVDATGVVSVSGTGLPTSLGQKTMANSTSVAIASDQSSVPVTLQAGSALAGKVGLDQTTPGTTNAVAIGQIGSTTVATGNGVVGTGVQRVAIASDNTAISVNATIAANQSVNVSQINAVTPLMGNGVTGTGSQRVTIASDNTAFTVNNQAIPQSGSTNACSSLASTALEASHVVKASAGRLYQLTGVNTKASAQYIQVFNSASVPADTTAPVLLAYVGSGANFSFDFGSIGRYFSTGISVSNSSTAATKTIGSADCWFNAEYL